jgi:FKBP-type peptidyl-prolyl cis-trans isomerase
MRLHLFFVSLLVVAVLPACIDAPTVPTCTPVTPVISSESGDTIILTSGLRYIVTAAGEGREAQSCRLVLLHYDLFLDDNRIDSSRGRAPLIITPGAGQLIPGFEQGIVGMREGEARRLIVPPALGYGGETVRNPDTGEVLIPPNSTIVFDVEVLEVEP